MALFRWQKAKESESELTPEEKAEAEAQQKKIDDAAKAAAELPEIKTKLNSLDNINKWIEDQKKEKEEAARKAKEAEALKNKEKNDEQLEELFLTDPKKAVELATQGQQQLLLTLRADNIKREVFEDADKFKYYHGDIKAEVDKLLEGQSIAARNDRSVVENCYLTVVGKHHDEIMEGKIKSRFAQGTSSGHLPGSAGADKDKKDRVITEDVKKLAKSFGVTPEDYADMLDKEGIGYV